MNKFILLLLLLFFNGIQSLPTRDLSDEDWDALFDLIDKSKNQQRNHKEFYESFTLEPIIIKMDFDDNFNRHDLSQLTPTTATEKMPEENSLWTSVKSFFTNDLNSIAKDVVDNYNPIPPIASAIDDVKRSDTWIDVNSFFTKGYNRLVKFSESVIDDIKESINK